MARERGSGHRRWESAAMCVSHLSFGFYSVLECRSAITLVFLVVPIEAEIDPSLFFHSVPRSSELSKRWFLAIRQADWSNFRVSNSTTACIAHVLPEKKFTFNARALDPVDSSITSSLKPRKARHFPKADAVPFFFLFARMSPKWEYRARRGIERKRDVYPHRRLGQMRRPLTIRSWRKARGRDCNAGEFCAMRLFFFQVTLGRAPGVNTQCVCEVTIERYLEFKKLGFLEY